MNGVQECAPWRYDKKVLHLVFSDQLDWGLSRFLGNGLNCRTDPDEHTTPSLCRLFREVQRYDIYKSANAAGPLQANREILAIAESFKPDYVIYHCNFSGLISPFTLEALRAGGAKVVSFFGDDDELFDHCTKHMLPFTDYCVTQSAKRVEDYKACGTTPLYFPTVPLDTAIFRRTGAPMRYDVSFIGSLAFGRDENLRQLRQKGVDVKVFDSSHYRRKLHSCEYVGILNSSRINLHFSKNRTPDGRMVQQIKGRIFETCFCGAFLLCEHVDGIDKIFEPGKEIAVFKTLDEAAEMARHYLKNEDERKEIAERGCARARRDYGAMQTISHVFDLIESGEVAPNPGSSSGSTLAGVKSAAENPVVRATSRMFAKCAMALLHSPFPARAHWRENAEAALRLDPEAKAAKRMLARATLFGDPAPFRLLVATGLSILTKIASRLIAASAGR